MRTKIIKTWVCDANQCIEIFIIQIVWYVNTSSTTEFQQCVTPSSGRCVVFCCLCSKGFCTEFWCFLSLWAAEHSSTQQSLSAEASGSSEELILKLNSVWMKISPHPLFSPSQSWSGSGWIRGCWFHAVCTRRDTHSSCCYIDSQVLLPLLQ